MASVDDCTLSGDSTELDSPLSKKPKIESDTEPEEDADSFVFNGRQIRENIPDDPECDRQRDLFYKQLNDSEGFDVDWDSFDYVFCVYNFFWGADLDDKLSNDELLKLLIQKAIEEHDEEHGTELKFVKYVSANIVACRGLMYYITFWAEDLKSSNQEPKPYQAKVCHFCDEFEVDLVREKPT